ncbi:hypothetical protein ES332_D08G272700v1 [Gossypium tomentosum]|uniref:Uncharacterized protein n=1 Tax=Gossypium tomentosum TaxID=34277 RepID=A0A5D2JZE2_GOSTO|nr:hypothetical protein ES332_D08G272700v1 [Gossypium tomentosum]
MQTTFDFNLFSDDNGEGRNPIARYNVRRVDVARTEARARAKARSVLRLVTRGRLGCVMIGLGVLGLG